MSDFKDQVTEIFAQMKLVGDAIKDKIEEIKAGKAQFDQRLKRLERGASDIYQQHANEFERIQGDITSIQNRLAVVQAELARIQPAPAPGILAPPINKQSAGLIASLQAEQRQLTGEWHQLQREATNIISNLNTISSRGFRVPPALLALYRTHRPNHAVFRTLEAIDNAAAAVGDPLANIRRQIDTDYSYAGAKLDKNSACPPLKQLLVTRDDLGDLQKIPSSRMLIQHGGLYEADEQQYIGLVHKAEDISRAASKELDKIGDARKVIEEELKPLEHFIGVA